jgi:hypothetical protein
VITVSELIQRLSQLPPDHLVVISSDAEGNDYHVLDDVEVGRWIQSDFHYTTWIEDEETGEERSVTDEEANAICLWP